MQNTLLKLGRTLIGATNNKFEGKEFRHVSFCKKITSVISFPIAPKKKDTIIQEKSFEEVAYLWLTINCVRQKGATLLKYKYMLEKHIIPELGCLFLSQITSDVINAFIKQKLQSGRLNEKGGLSPAYVKTMTLLIKSVMQFASDEKFCQPLKTQICKLTEEKKAIQILKNDEQKRLENYIYKQRDLTSLGIIISLYSGLRIGEICALRWKDIDLDNKIIHVTHTISRVSCANTGSNHTCLILDRPKTESSIRDIPILPPVFCKLQKAKVQGADGFVVSGTDTFVSPRTFEYRFHKIINECGLRNFNYHTLRHTFATRCVEAGVDTKSLSEILGHANVGITLKTYVHSSMEMKRQQLEKLQMFFV